MNTETFNEIVKRYDFAITPIFEQFVKGKATGDTLFDHISRYTTLANELFEKNNYHESAIVTSTIITQTLKVYCDIDLEFEETMDDIDNNTKLIRHILEKCSNDKITRSFVTDKMYKAIITDIERGVTDTTDEIRDFLMDYLNVKEKIEWLLKLRLDVLNSKNLQDVKNYKSLIKQLDTSIRTKNLEQAAPADLIEILEYLLRNRSGRYPQKLIEKIIEKSKWTTPILLESLKEFTENWSHDMEDSEWLKGATALFILAKLREKKAFPYAIKLSKIPRDDIEDFLGDITTEFMHSILASTFDGNLEALHSIVINQQLYEFARGAVLQVYGHLYKHNKISRKDLIATLNSFFNKLYNDHSYVPSQLVSICCDMHATELSEKINFFIDRNLVDPFFTGFEEIKKRLSLTREEAMENLKSNTSYDFINDLQEDMAWLFRKDAEDEFELDENNADKFTNPKIGRNEPCPCGSDKKYKKCCLL
ncbi:MAG: DUF1186 domain-containing protein [bacterium]